MGRRTLRQRKERFREKHGMKSLPRFAGKRPREKVIYRNPLAKPVPELAAKGQRKPFSMENVQWISIGKEMIGGSYGTIHIGYGTIHFGRIKFRGKKPTAVIIKKFHGPKLLELEKEKIRRLDQSKVPHPKMDCIRIGENDYIIMEPFTKSTKPWGEKESKFLERRGDLVRQLNFLEKKDCKQFRKILWAALKLAKAGLVLEPSRTRLGEPRADAFNAIRLKSGEIKVLVQDLDTLQCYDLSTESNFRITARALLKVVNYNKIAVQEVKAFQARTNLE